MAKTEKKRRRSRLILVSGLPATGKSTLADTIGDALSLPVITKDTIKELLFDTIGWSDRAWSMKLGGASMELLWFIAAQHVRVGSSVVLESNFSKSFTDPQLAKFRAQWPIKVIEVHCVADREVILERYRARAAEGERHPGHMEWNAEQMETDLLPRIRDAQDQTLDGADMFIEIDTTDFSTLDIPAEIEKIRAAF
ncbi:MAG: AAA family ATPase [Thermomicrobiales bacterium]